MKVLVPFCARAEVRRAGRQFDFEACMWKLLPFFFSLRGVRNYVSWLWKPVNESFAPLLRSRGTSEITFRIFLTLKLKFLGRFSSFWSLSGRSRTTFTGFGSNPWIWWTFYSCRGLWKMTFFRLQSRYLKIVFYCCILSWVLAKWRSSAFKAFVSNFLFFVF